MSAQLQLPYSASVPAALRPLSPALTAPACPADATVSPTAGRSALERRARLTAKLAKLAATGQLAPLARQIAGLGGCAHPIRLTGHRTRLDTATGEVLDHFDSGRLPAGELLVRCGNRRATRCPACSTVYRYDTYQLIAAGLRGGKTVPTTVAAHPRVFATLTAPGFGPVHNQPDTGHCHCGQVHSDDDQLLGTPLDPERYDYTGAVLWNAHAPVLWARFTTHLRREIAKVAGLTQRDLRHHATLSYAKVAEYQKRGQIHFHAVIRLDGPTGPTSTPPAWATTQLLDHAVRAAAQRARVRHEGEPPKQPQPARDISASQPENSDREGRLVFRFGRQIDVRAIRGTDFTEGGPVTDRHVAAYIAKYATKGAETTTGTLDRRLRFLAELANHDITGHARRMIHTAWHLATNRRHAHLRLRQWAHMLGFRGHFSTRTRHYSTTLAHLRAERTAWRTSRPDTQTPNPPSAETQAGQTGGSPIGDQAQHSTDPAAGHRPGHRNSAGQRVDSDSTLVISHWQYAGIGLLPELEHLADLLTATRQTRPEQPPHTRHSKRSSDRADDRAGHPIGHSTDRLTSAVRAGGVA
ncbi:Replication initiation protein [Streptomyces sp. IBSBF 2953]|uniref:replication initiator n=1 Tax=Streptomyces hayashii TaxID=2839966 RepID=UPI00211A9E55|nr:Replication initiation protein [Streptomyces hayashii]